MCMTVIKECMESVHGTQAATIHMHSRAAVTSIARYPARLMVQGKKLPERRKAKGQTKGGASGPPPAA